MQVSRTSSCGASAGFTLIEMMVVVAMIAILGSVAVPAYRDYVRRANLPEAFSTLANMRVQMEQFYQDNHTYADTNNAANCGVAPVDTRLFDYACQVNNGGQGFLLTATGNADVVVEGHSYTLDNQNNRSTLMFKGESVSGSNCWATKAKDDC